MSLPPHMRADLPAAADPARRRLLQKSPFPRLPSFPTRPPSIHLLSPAPSSHNILLDDPPLPDDHPVRYRWAVLDENQRGLTLFSTPFYSARSLLPSDPPPFTIPHHHPRDADPALSPDNYPLPDGTWKWVSAAWMVDMRTCSGETQHDGFQYNSSFRERHWHANTGTLSTGAWVRRRRWLRLMMRPAHANPNASSLASSDPDHDVSHVWDGSEQDWQHLHRLLRQLGRDGRKLELWRWWLGPPDPLHSLEKRLSHIVPDGIAPPRQHLATVLAHHGKAILYSFVFPDSRAQFVALVQQAGLADVLASGLGRHSPAPDVDFWSYVEKHLTD